MRVVLAGGSGALGRRLVDALLAHGHEPVVLTRSPGRRALPPGAREVGWDGEQVGPWAEELSGAAVVNLAGELVDRRPTRSNVDLLRESRVRPTRALVAASHQGAPVGCWIQSSTLAIYGDAGDRVLTEESPPADGPPQMAGVAGAWERAVQGAHSDRLVVLRTGIVLDAAAPALHRLAGLTRWGLGGRIASGSQWTSWLHIDDFVAIVLAVLADEHMHGVVHATSPNPVTNRELMAELRSVLHRPPSPPTPAIAVRLGALLLRTDPALALTGRRAIPDKLQQWGFRFSHPYLRGALADLLD